MLETLRVLSWQGELNLGCWIFYQEGYVNVDRNREVRADRYEDISTLSSFEANCADKIYAEHVAEHVDDVKASSGRWFEVLKPGGPHRHNSAGLSRHKSNVVGTKTFSRLGVRARRRNHRHHHGVKADDLGDKKKEEILRNRVFDESTLRICMESVGFINIAPVDNNEAMVAPSSTLGWQLALEGYKPKRS